MADITDNNGTVVDCVCYHCYAARKLSVLGVSMLYPHVSESALMSNVTVHFCCVRPLTGNPIPTPSKYFHTLHSVHGGNLKVRGVLVTDEGSIVLLCYSR